MPRRLMIGAATILLLFVLWRGATTVLGLIAPGRFPSPSATRDAFTHLAFRG